MPRYELVDGKSSKFWEIELEGSSFTTTYGRIGTDGQSKTKDFDDDEGAEKEHDKLIAQKEKKGYVLTEGGGVSGGGATKKKATKKKAAKKAPAKKSSTVAPSNGAPVGWTRYEFVEGNSSKFWAITREGATVKTNYGRIGTDGQTTIKSFDDEAKAQKEYDKLVHQKTKKGYALVG